MSDVSFARNDEVFPVTYDCRFALEKDELSVFLGLRKCTSAEGTRERSGYKRKTQVVSLCTITYQLSGSCAAPGALFKRPSAT